MCNCLGWCRDFSEMDGLSGSIKPSKHHPNCEDYKLVRYVNIKLIGGNGLITEPEMVNEIIESEVGNDGYSREDFSVTDIFMTQDQYESMQEFDGF